MSEVNKTRHVRSAIVGARRGRQHARAYENIDFMKLEAFCDRDEQVLSEACLEFNFKKMCVTGYTDYETMLREVKPDVVHIVTSPAIPRAQWIEPAVAAGVKVLLLEKPYALTPAEHDAVARAVSKAGDMVVAINHQRRYMPFAYVLRGMLADNALGEIQHVYAQAQGEIMEMATHLMDLVLMVAGDQDPLTVTATINGGTCYENKMLQCPDNLVGVLTFPERMRVTFEVQLKALAPPDWTNVDPNHTIDHYPNRCNLHIYGNKGRFWWREYGDYGYVCPDIRPGYAECADAVVLQEKSDYTVDDIFAQHALTSVAGLVATGQETAQERLHNRFELAWKGLRILFTMYKAALRGTTIEGIQPCSEAEWLALKDWILNRDPYIPPEGA